jgi:NADH pyrophosphatase NudC (nudix superfamily)
MGGMDGITNRDSREARGKAISARMKAYWARRRAAVETEVREEPRSEPVPDRWATREAAALDAIEASEPLSVGMSWEEFSARQVRMAAKAREAGLAAAAAEIREMVSAVSVCRRCGHALAGHDFRGCQETRCRCGGFKR